MAKWGRMLVATSRDQGGNVDMWGVKPAKERKLRERVYKGVPDCWRSAAWEVLMCRYSRTGKAELRQLMKEYQEALDKPSSYAMSKVCAHPRLLPNGKPQRACLLTLCAEQASPEEPPRRGGRRSRALTRSRG